jgi:hypothetical protein
MTDVLQEVRLSMLTNFKINTLFNATYNFILKIKLMEIMI